MFDIKQLYALPSTQGLDDREAKLRASKKRITATGPRGAGGFNFGGRAFAAAQRQPHIDRADAGLRDIAREREAYGQYNDILEGLGKEYEEAAEMVNKELNAYRLGGEELGEWAEQLVGKKGEWDPRAAAAEAETTMAQKHEQGQEEKLRRNRSYGAHPTAGLGGWSQVKARDMAGARTGAIQTAEKFNRERKDRNIGVAAGLKTAQAGINKDILGLSVDAAKSAAKGMSAFHSANRPFQRVQTGNRTKTYDASGLFRT